MNLSLLHKTALIGGGSQGIGLATARELALLGANCILLARHEDALTTALAGLDIAQRQQHRSYCVDLFDTDGLRHLAANIAEAGPVHILINNSGGPSGGPIEEASTLAFEATFRQHLISAQVLVQALLPGMKAAGYGRIIQIISTSVKTPLHNLGVSNTIRAAVASWAKTLSNEVAHWGITVNNVLPGATTTGRLSSLIEKGAAQRGLSIEDVENEWKQTIPARRFGAPEEIAAVAAFLATPAAAYVNGTSIPVDGGRTPVV